MSSLFVRRIRLENFVELFSRFSPVIQYRLSLIEHFRHDPSRSQRIQMISMFFQLMFAKDLFPSLERRLLHRRFSLYPSTSGVSFLFRKFHHTTRLANFCKAAPFLSIGFFPNAHAETVLPKSKLSEEDLSRLIEIFQVTIEDEQNATFEAKQHACFEKVLEECQQENWDKIEACRNELNFLTNPFGQTLFLYAVSTRNIKLLERLIEKKIGLNSRDSHGNTALHLTARNGDVELFGKLWEYIPIDAKNKEGQTPLHVAILSGQADMVAAIVANVRNCSSLLVWQSLEITPLALAALRGEIECFEALLKKVPFSDANTEIGNILHLIIHFQQNEMLKYLLQNEVYFRTCQDYMTQPNSQGYTPLSYAVLVDNPNAVAHLCARGAEIEAQDRKQRRPLHLAALSDNHFIVKCLVGWHCDVSPKDEQLQTPSALAPEGSATKSFLYNLEQQEEIRRDEILHYRYQPPQNLIFQGGGPKGIAYIGALRALEKEKALSEVQRVAGTSAGAIMAALLAMNFSVERIKALLQEKSLTEFLDHNLSEREFKAIESVLKKPPLFHLENTKNNWHRMREIANRIKQLYNHPSVSNAFHILAVFYQNYSELYQIYVEQSGNYREGRNLLELLRALLKSLSKQPGVCAGKDFEDWIEGQISAGTGKHHCTFGELRDLILQGKHFKHLHVFAIQIIGERQNLIQFNSEDKEWDDVVISSAIRASMSIPGVFIPAIIKRKKKGKTTPDNNFGSFIDGGAVYNVPIEAFDKKRYMISGVSQEEGEFPMFNKRTLGLSLFSSDEKRSHSLCIQNVGQLLQAMIAVFYDVEELIRQRTPYNAHRVIEIDNMGVGLLDFDLGSEMQKALIHSGEKATQVFYDKQEGVNSQSLFNFPKLRLAAKGFHLMDVHPHFVGRQALLSQIHTALSEKPVLLCGPPGVGKSETTLAYANAHLSDFEFVFFFEAETPESLEQSYRRLAKTLGLYIERDDHDVIRRRVHDKLESQGKWLLIYDNAQTAFPLPKGGKILITSRKRLWNLPQSPELIEVLPFEEEDAIELLQKVTGETVSSAMKQLVERVGYYPLVLGQIASYIKRVEHFSISQYFEECSEKGVDFERMTPQERYEKTLEEVFEKTLSLMEPLEKQWLYICAYLSPDAIPTYFLDEWLKSEHSEESMVATRDDVLANLSTDLALLRYNPSTNTYSIHRLFQEILRGIDSGSSGHEICCLLVNLWNKIDFENIYNWGKGYSIAEFVYSTTLYYMSKSSRIPETIRVVFFTQTAEFEFLQGKYQKALEKHQQVLEILQGSLEPNHRDIAMILYNIGRCLLAQGKYLEALKKHEQALAKLQESLDPNHRDIAMILDNIGVCLDSQGKYSEALKKHEQALAIRRKSWDPNHPHIATSLSNIGRCLHSQGKYPEALKKHEQALAIRQKSLDPNHPDIAKSLNNIGNCLYSQGKYPEALKKYEQALAIRRKSLDPNHPHIAISLNNIGSCLYSQGKYPEALKKHELALAIWRKSLDPNHPHIATSLSNIGRCLRAQGKYPEALEKHEQALVIRQKSLDPNHPHIAASLYYIGSCLESQGKYPEALKKHEQAYKRAKASLGDDHPDTQLYLENLRKAQDACKVRLWLSFALNLRDM